MSAPPPTPSSLTVPFLQEIHSFYPQVLSRFYDSKVKDSRKRAEAIENDKWRYETLPEIVKGRKQDEGLSQEEVERLVLWKITHQTNRPFLLPQIRKNPPSVMRTSSAEAQQMLLSSSSRPSLRTLTSALAATSVPKGVGPATASLLLSVFSPKHIPFFEDELYQWLFPEAEKLKYNVKEYTALVEGVWEVTDRFNKDGNGRDVEAWMLEKVGFVIGHWDLLEEEERRATLKVRSESREESIPQQMKRKRELGSDGADEVENVKTDESSERPAEKLPGGKKMKKERQQNGKEQSKQDDHGVPRRSGRNR